MRRSGLGVALPGLAAGAAVGAAAGALVLWLAYSAAEAAHLGALIGVFPGALIGGVTAVESARRRYLVRALVGGLVGVFVGGAFATMEATENAAHGFPTWDWVSLAAAVGSASGAACGVVVVTVSWLLGRSPRGRIRARLARLLPGRAARVCHGMALGATLGCIASGAMEAARRARIVAQTGGLFSSELGFCLLVLLAPLAGAAWGLGRALSRSDGTAFRRSIRAIVATVLSAGLVACVTYVVALVTMIADPPMAGGLRSCSDFATLVGYSLMIAIIIAAVSAGLGILSGLAADHLLGAILGPIPPRDGSSSRVAGAGTQGAAGPPIS